MIHSKACPAGLRGINTLRDAKCPLPLGCRPHIGITSAWFVNPTAGPLSQRTGDTHAQVHSAHAIQAAAAATAGAQPAQGAAAEIAGRLEQLQYCVAHLDVQLSADGLLTAYQQLQHIQRQLLQELRSCQAAIHRAKWRAAASSRRSSRASSPGSSTTPSLTASQHEEDEQPADSQQQQLLQGLQESEEAAQLTELRHLRLKCDDAQDCLVGLMRAYLQDEPPCSATRLLTIAASRQMNVAALNRTCVQVFLDKQGESTLADMAGLMAALALVRCCSKHRHQVAGLNQHELAVLFSGVMTHLLAHAENTLSNQQQQQQRQAAQGQTETSCNSSSSSASRTRSSSTHRAQEAATAQAACSVTIAPPAAAATPAQQQQQHAAADATDELRRQVAAAVAAHVSGRVPLASALIPHIFQILGDHAPNWLHNITDLQAATSVAQLQGMVMYPSRFDYTFLATALHRLSELTEQQQQLLATAEAAAPAPAGGDAASEATQAAAAARAELARGNRLARKLYGRLQQLAQDATAAELACVLQATSRMAPAAGEVYAVPALQFAQGPQLQQATETQIASVMHAVAAYSSSATIGSDSSRAAGGFSKQQQQIVLKACTQKVCKLLQQQQQQQQQSTFRSVRSAAKGSAAMLVEPSTVVMAVWALATSSVQVPKALTTRLFEYICQPNSLHVLLGPTGSSSSSTKAALLQRQQQQPQPSWEEAARNSCTILWAAAQLQYMQPDLALVRSCVDTFMAAMPMIPVACSSSTTVLQAVASLLAAQQRQQQQQQQPGGAQSIASQVAAALQQQDQRRKDNCVESDYWRSIFLRCTDEVVQRLLQQQQQGVAAGSSTNVAEQQQAVSAAAAMQHDNHHHHHQQQQQQGCAGGVAAAAEASSPAAVSADGVCPVTAACQIVWAHHVAGFTMPDKHVLPLVQLLGNQTPSWLLETAITRAGSVAAVQQLLQSPAAAAADLSCIAAAFRQLLQLQEQAVQAVQQQQAAVDVKAHEQLLKQCCQQISTLAAQIPALQQQQQQPPRTKQLQQQQQDAAPDHSDSATAAAQAAAAAAANVMWATAQLQHKDSWLSGSCLRTFLAAAAPASAAEAAAVVAATAAPGRLVHKVFAGCSRGQLQDVVRVCTAKLLSSTTASQAPVATPGSSSSSKSTMRRRPRTSSNQLVETTANQAAGRLVLAQFSKEKSVLLAQQLLQLHAVLQLQPTQLQLQLLLQVATNEAALDSMDDKAAAAALAAVLAAVAELGQLGQSNRLLTSPAAAVPAAPAAAGAGKGIKGKAPHNPKHLLQQSVAEQDSHQLQLLLQDLLLYGMLPRMRGATPKQVVTCLEAAAALASHSTATAGATSADQKPYFRFLSLELSLARDFARGVFQEIMAPANAAAAAGSAEEATSFLSGWKGEHVASVAAAAVRLGVSCSAFFSAVEADVLVDGATAAAAVEGASSVEPQQQQQQQRRRRRSRIEKLQLQHLVTLCTCAAALHCRVEQLLVYTCKLTNEQLQQQQQQQQQLDPVQLLLLAWSAAEMDVPQLLQPVQNLTAAGAAAMGAFAGAGSSSSGREAASGSQAGDYIITASSWLQQVPGVAAKLFQLHIWLSDRQQQQQSTAASSDTTAALCADSSSSSGDAAPPSSARLVWGVSNLLLAEELQLARELWLQVQLTSRGGACEQQLAAVAAALQQLPGIEQLQLQSITPDGCLVVDLEARVQGIPVAGLLLNDLEEHNMQQGGGTVGPVEQQQHYRGLAAAGVGGVSSSSSSSGVLQASLHEAHIGDVMYRARVLAARGYWVVVISMQQWAELEGRLDAEVQYLLGKLWLLQNEFQGVNFVEGAEAHTGDGDGGLSDGSSSWFVTGMPVTAAATASSAEEDIPMQ